MLKFSGLIGLNSCLNSCNHAKLLLKKVSHASVLNRIASAQQIMGDIQQVSSIYVDGRCIDTCTHTGHSKLRIQITTGIMLSDTEAGMIPGVSWNTMLIQTPTVSQDSAAQCDYRILLHPSSPSQPKNPTLRLVRVEVAPRCRSKVPEDDLCMLDAGSC